MIIDAIIFGGEVDVLEARLHELDSVADRFVVVESAERHGSRDVRPFALPAALEGPLRRFAGKVEFSLLGALQPPHGGPNDSWPRENFHRNAIAQVVRDVATSGDDIVMVSDCDEIPRAEAVRMSTEALRQGLRAFSQDMFYYDVNNYMGNWNGTVGGTVGALLQSSPQEWRNRRDSLPTIGAGGWHFSYFGGYDRILYKVGNFAHACEDSARLARHWLETGHTSMGDLLGGMDLYRRAGCDRRERRSQDDPRLPAWVRANMPRNWTEDGLREATA